MIHKKLKIEHRGLLLVKLCAPNVSDMVQKMVWWRQTRSRYFNKLWPKSFTYYSFHRSTLKVQTAFHGLVPYTHHLTNCSRNEMATIWQATSFNIFPLMTIMTDCLWFHYNQFQLEWMISWQWIVTENAPSLHDDVIKCKHFSALLAICAANSPVTGEFPPQRPVTRSFNVFFALRLNKRLSKQSWGWWFETPSRPLWRHYNVFMDSVCPCTRYHITALGHFEFKGSNSQ